MRSLNEAIRKPEEMTAAEIAELREMVVRDVTERMRGGVIDANWRTGLAAILVVLEVAEQSRGPRAGAIAAR